MSKSLHELSVTNQCVLVCELGLWSDEKSPAWTLVSGTQDEVGRAISELITRWGVKRLDDFGGVCESFLCQNGQYLQSPPKTKGGAGVFSFTPKNRVLAEGQEMAKVASKAGYSLLILTVQKNDKYGKVWVLKGALRNLSNTTITYFEDTNTLIDEIKVSDEGAKVIAVHVQAPGFEDQTSHLADRYLTQSEYHREVLTELDLSRAKTVKYQADKVEPIKSESVADLKSKRSGSIGNAPLISPMVSAGSRNSGSLEKDEGVFPFIPRYDFISRLGEGGFGVVYLAKDRILKKNVAVKIVRIRSGGFNSQVSSSGQGHAIPELNEAWRMASMEHGHILKVLDAGEISKSEIFITTEYIQGKNLRGWIEGGNRSQEKIIEMVIAIARALEHAHRQGIYHRDIKPENILLDECEKPYLMDFGLSLHESDYSAREIGLAGTIRYMSPEQASGKAMMVDGRSDIFSVGVLMYELFTGRKPFRGESNADILEQIITTKPVPMRQKVMLSHELEAICMKCLEKLPENRFQSAGDLAEELENLTGKLVRPSSISRSFVKRLASVSALLMINFGLISYDLSLIKYASGNWIPDSVMTQISEKSPVKLHKTLLENPNPIPVVAPDNDQLATKTLAIFTAKCKKCHHDEQNGLLDDILHHRKLISEKDSDEMHFIKPGKIAESSIWKQIEGPNAKMPPKDKGTRLTDEEQLTIRTWIEAGAPAWKLVAPAKQRELVSLEQMYEAILADQKKLTNRITRKNRRYFSLIHLWNNPEVTDETLQVTAIALSKLVNSLSWERKLTVPVNVEKTGYLMAVDLADYGWEKGDQWNRVINRDPYRLSFGENKRIVEIEKQINELAENPLGEPLWVRTDWFVVEASRPPLYNNLLDLPEKIVELEKLLDVDVESDFIKSRIVRAGLIKSGVSNQNRVVDRHASKYGYYWKSYDFAPRKIKSDILAFPLGPVFKANPFNQVAFEADGGEMIFTLPNGLMAYFLAKSSGERLETAPIDIVEDRLALANQGHSIINGISCISCHAEGVKQFKDELRQAHVLKGIGREKLDEILKDQPELNKTLDSDRKRFLDSLRQVVEPFLRIPGEFDGSFQRDTEPLAQVSRLYYTPLTIESLKYELYAQKDVEFANRLKHNPDLDAKVMKVIGSEGRLKRDYLDQLENRDSGKSTYGFIARELEIGTPFSQSK
jgi:serine/threonine-protein kinase